MINVRKTAVKSQNFQVKNVQIQFKPKVVFFQFNLKSDHSLHFSIIGQFRGVQPV